MWIEPDDWHSGLTCDPASGTVQLRILAPEGGILRIDASTDLEHWDPLGFYAGERGVIEVSDSIEGQPARFYRLVPLW
jgi:hypothetical protein